MRRHRITGAASAFSRHAELDSLAAVETKTIRQTFPGKWLWLSRIARTRKLITANDPLTPAPAALSGGRYARSDFFQPLTPALSQREREISWPTVRFSSICRRLISI